MKFEESKFTIPYWNHIWQSRFVLLVMICHKFLRNYIWRSASYKKVTLNTVTSLTVNSVMDTFLQVLLTFQNIAVFKTIFKNKFCQWINQNTNLIQSRFSAHCLISASKNDSTEGLCFHPCTATSIDYFYRLLKDRWVPGMLFVL